MVDWPELKYPLSDHIAENRAAESATLAQVEEIIQHAKRTQDRPVAAVVVEPIASEGGDLHASPEFFRGLRKITKENGVFLIVGACVALSTVHASVRCPFSSRMTTYFDGGL